MSRIERWARQLLEKEARKRGVFEPEGRTRQDLLRGIVQHDVQAGQALRENARKLMGALIETAAAATLPLFNRQPHTAQPPSLMREAQATLKGLQPIAAALSFAPAATSSRPQAQPELPSRLIVERNHAELQLNWEVTHAATDRARLLLGHPGELALRIVSVRRDPTQVLQSEVAEHGPVAENGVWTLQLPSADAHCVGSVGIRHGERFVSIVHVSSRAQ
ncbi:MAG: hypothetical protein RL701_8140 [Pseudomonadota bacterium]